MDHTSGLEHHEHLVKRKRDRIEAVATNITELNRQVGVLAEREKRAVEEHLANSRTWEAAACKVHACETDMSHGEERRKLLLERLEAAIKETQAAQAREREVRNAVLAEEGFIANHRTLSSRLRKDTSLELEKRNFSEQAVQKARQDMATVMKKHDSEAAALQAAQTELAHAEREFDRWLHDAMQKQQEQAVEAIRTAASHKQMAATLKSPSKYHRIIPTPVQAADPIDDRIRELRKKKTLAALQPESLERQLATVEKQNLSNIRRLARERLAALGVVQTQTLADMQRQEHIPLTSPRPPARAIMSPTVRQLSPDIDECPACQNTEVGSDYQTDDELPPLPSGAGQAGLNFDDI